MPKKTTKGTRLRITDRVTPDHGRVFVEKWFEKVNPTQAADAFESTELIEWPDEQSNDLTPAQLQHHALSDEILRRTFEPLRDVIAASFIVAAAEVLGRDVIAEATKSRDREPDELYANHEPQVRAILAVARAARRAATLLPNKFSSADVIQHLVEPAGGWAWSLIEIIMDYEEKEREHTL